MTRRSILLQKENDCKFQLCFVKCCTLEGYHKLLSPLNRLVRCHFILFRICISKEPAGNIISRKGSVASVDGVGGSEPLRRAFRGWSPLRKFFGSKEYLDWFNDTRKTFTQFSTRIYRNTSLADHDLFPIFTQSINFYILYCHIIKEYRCLKNVIHQLERNKWLLLSAFQQGLQQKLVFVLTQENAFL